MRFEALRAGAAGLARGAEGPEEVVVAAQLRKLLPQLGARGG